MRRFILTFIAIISICATYAQTLDECRQLAREHYPEIRQYDLINATEQYNLSNAARAWIPQIKLSAQAYDGRRVGHLLAVIALPCIIAFTRIAGIYDSPNTSRSTAHFSHGNDDADFDAIRHALPDRKSSYIL